MNTKQMVKDWLESHGFSGLISPDGACSCRCDFDECDRFSECSQAVFDAGTTTLVEAVDPPLETIRERELADKLEYMREIWRDR